MNYREIICLLIFWVLLLNVHHADAQDDILPDSLLIKTDSLRVKKFNFHPLFEDFLRENFCKK